MGSVSTVSSSTVCPANPTQEKHCSLSPFDLQLAEANYIQYVLFFQHGFANNSHEVTIERLKSSLAEVLVYFYPFAGRLVDSPDGFLNIECNDEGAQFTEVVADATLDQILLHKSPRYIQELLFPLNHSICADGRSLPLLAVQVTQLKDAVAIAFSMNHMVVDGYSAWHFINSWSEICRGSLAIANSPSHHRFRAGICTSSTTTTNQNSKVYLQSVEAAQRLPPLSHDIQETVFCFSNDMITHLKNRINTHEKKTGTVIYSSFKALAIHIWVAITRARKLKSEEQTTLSLAVDCRGRLVPPLPKSYFGNAVHLVHMTTTVGELLNNSNIISTVNLLQEIIEAAQRDERIRFKIEEWMKNPNLASVQGIANHIVIGSSPRFPVYESDFGFGPPMCVRSGGGNKYDGKVTLFPGREGGGSVDMEICLWSSALQMLNSDAQFLLQDLNC
eukprot:PITA_26140